MRLPRIEELLTCDRDGRVSLVDITRGLAQSFQGIETPTFELVLISLESNRYLKINPKTHKVTAGNPGPEPDGRDGTRFIWMLPGR